MLPLLLLLVAGDTSAYWQQQVAYQITAAPRPRRFPRGGDRLAGAPLDPAAAPGTPGPALRFRAVVSQGRGVRPLRVGTPPAVSGRRVLRRVRRLRRHARPP